MQTINTQELAAEYADIILADKLRAIMAVRYYGEAVVQKRHIRTERVEAFYAAMKTVLADAYRTTISHMSSRERLALEQAVAVKVYERIQDMLLGCIR